MTFPMTILARSGAVLTETRLIASRLDDVEVDMARLSMIGLERKVDGFRNDMRQGSIESCRNPTRLKTDDGHICPTLLDDEPVLGGEVNIG